jgi:hypothetical protein
MQHNTALLESIDYFNLEKLKKVALNAGSQTMTSPSPLTTQSEARISEIVATLSRTVAPTLPEMIALLTFLAALAARDKTMGELPDKLAQALLIVRAASSMPQFLTSIEEAGI